MRYYIDTEFIERPGTIDLISVGIIADDGREYYAISSEYDPSKADEWVWLNVLLKLEPESQVPRKPRIQIAREILEFVRLKQPEQPPIPDMPTVLPKVEFWGYFADYDWVVFCWLFGRMVDLPKGMPMFCNDLKQEMDRVGISKRDLPAQPEGARHNALADAYWIRTAHHHTQGRR